MKILINTLIIAGLLVASTAQAHDRRYSHNHHDRYSPYYYQHYHHNHHSGHRRRSDNDDWAWAVGGLVLGAIIADSANSNSNPPQNSQPLPPPQKRKVVTCYDEVAYDSDNKPYVARQCYETMQ